MNTLEQVKALIGDHAGLVVSLIGDDQPLGDGTPDTEDGPGVKGLEFDSLDRIELAMKIGEHFGFDIPDEDVDRLEMSTAAGIARYVDQRLAGHEPAFMVGGATILGPPLDPQFQGAEDESKRVLNEAWPLDAETVEITDANGGDWSPAFEDETNYVDMQPGDMLAAVGTDARKWAVAFMQTAARGPIMDDAFMFAWFANAIEAGRSAGMTAAREEIERVMAEPDPSTA